MSSYNLLLSLDENIKLIKSKYSENRNLEIRTLSLNKDTSCAIIYVDGLTNLEHMEKSIVTPLLLNKDIDFNTIEEKARYAAKKIILSSSLKIVKDISTISSSLLLGNCAILIDNCDECILCKTPHSYYRSISESTLEGTIRGARDAFIESLDTNIALIQQKLRSSNLKIENYTLANKSPTRISLLYVDGIADETLLNNIKGKISSLSIDYLPDSGYLIQYIEPRTYNIFPQGKVTEVPDKVVSDILQGKVAIIIDGSPQVLILPVVFIEFFQAFEDYSNNILIANFERFLRIMGALIIVLLSPIYLCYVEYNPQLIPLNLLKTISESRLNIPLNPFLEVLSMEILVEILREGGIRLPSPIGQTLAIVGGIILGDAAVRSGLVSPTTLVIVAIGVISTFLIPNYQMALSIRLIRFFMLILVKLLGLLGIILGIHLILLILINTNSFGVPYLSPITPYKSSGVKDSIFREKITSLNKLSSKLFRVKNKDGTQ
ncbi:spore germination protein [Clostridium sp. MSJ-4]|uniref:Spore germination protein n=1 Tax=Clostridium simiarum TaxID=2841506 RepID=A0ABS6F2Z8_9CLOT|nr:spore germination protein [Clostridium simiarum]MBU5592874.1 spore germination protein [Clostridium simiarum]